MCGICIAGFCIPQSVLLPLLLIGLQWIATQLSKFGLSIPDSIGKRIGLSLKSDGTKQLHLHLFSCVAGCLCGKRRTVRSSSDDGSAKAATTSSNDEGYGEGSEDDETWEDCPGPDDGTIASATSDNDHSSKGSGGGTWDDSVGPVLVEDAPTFGNIRFPDAQWCMPCSETT